ncbi:hypothetical protein NE612_09555 [Oscillibacter valericigenes]|nr:hypothetical protein [Oscillibacter valericigenes]
MKNQVIRAGSSFCASNRNSQEAAFFWMLIQKTLNWRSGWILWMVSFAGKHSPSNSSEHPAAVSGRKYA